MTKKILTKVISLLVTGMLLLEPQTIVLATTAQKVETQRNDKVRVQDDFYEAINGEWIRNTVIKPGYAENSSFRELDDKLEEDIKGLFEDLVKNEKDYESTSIEKKIINMYSNTLNMDQRNKQGLKPIQKYLEQIESVKSIEELTELLGNRDFYLLNTLMRFDVDADPKDSGQNILTIGSSRLQLGDPDYYNMPTELALSNKEITQKYMTKLLLLKGDTEEEAQTKVENILELEKVLATSMIGQKEASTDSEIYEKIYNIYTLEELDTLSPHLKLAELMKSLGYNKAKKIVLEEPEWLQKLDAIYIPENLVYFKNYLEINLLEQASPYLSQAFREADKMYVAELFGLSGEKPIEQEAIDLVSESLPDAVGKLYVEQCFSEEAKKDVETLVKEILKAYKVRIKELDWMSDTTKKNAIKKINHMGIKIGYPEEWDDYADVEIKSYEEGGSLMENMISLTKYAYENDLEQINDKVDRKKFNMSPQTVNAAYSPNNNDITFPAGILQPPFYDVKASKEEKLGAIGAIIGHEITHAFDTTGSLFDEKGNLEEWWTEEDYQKFDEKTQKVRDFYNQIQVLPGKKINGDLTVGENIADLGAVATMLDILSKMPHADYKAFFESWARIWKTVEKPAYQAQMLDKDVHSPAKYRVNAVVQQYEPFYETYKVTEKDKMYVRPEDRLKVF